MIVDVNNLTLIGSEKAQSIIWCNGDFGFVFMQVKGLNICNLHFYQCGAKVPQILTTLHTNFNITVYSISGKSLLLMVNITDMNISKVYIHNSTGPGLLGINVLGNSSVFQSLFVKNHPNCVFLFPDTLEVPSTLALLDSNFIAGVTQSQYHAAGLNIIIGKKNYIMPFQLTLKM